MGISEILIKHNGKLLAALLFFVGVESRMFELPKKLLSCTNVRLQTNAHKKKQ
jgi:hypothetical protein